MTDDLYQFVIYENPKDYPDKFVIRKWRVGDGGLQAALWPTVVTDTLTHARAFVPTGLVNIGRKNDDDPVIREVWI